MPEISGHLMCPQGFFNYFFVFLLHFPLRRSQVLTLKLYTAVEDFYSEETGNKFLKKGDKVEVLDTSRPEFWLVRRVSRGSEIGFVRHTCLKKDDDG